MSELTALIGSIQKFSVEDGPGIRTTVFLKGCPLSCRWCHNPEMIDPCQQLFHIGSNCIDCGHCIRVCPQGAIFPGSDGGIGIDRQRCDACLTCVDSCFSEALRPVAREMTVDQVMEKVLQDRSFYDRTGGGLTLSGGEILMHGEFALRLIAEAGGEGVGVCIDTSGFGDPHLLKKLAGDPAVTHVLYDVKAMDDAVHLAYTGVSNALMLDNLRMLADNDITRDKLIVRMPLIGGVNDTEGSIAFAGELFRELGLSRITLLPYHDLGVGKMRNIGGSQERFEAPSEERINEILSYFRNDVGMDAEILGRV